MQRWHSLFPFNYFCWLGPVIVKYPQSSYSSLTVVSDEALMVIKRVCWPVHSHTNPWEKLSYHLQVDNQLYAWPDVWSGDLQKKSMINVNVYGYTLISPFVIHNTECSTERIGIIKQHGTQTHTRLSSMFSEHHK